MRLDEYIKNLDEDEEINDKFEKLFEILEEFHKEQKFYKKIDIDLGLKFKIV